MIFYELLEKYKPEVEAAIAQLFDTAFKNQEVENDLLLVLIHGFKVKNPDDWERQGYSPYVVGPDHVGFEEDAFYHFFHSYRSNVANKQNFDSLKNEEANHQFLKDEQLTINLEFLIYLKIWENDFFLRQLFNLIRLCNGESYNWEFKPKIFDSREVLISNKITARAQKVCPLFFTLMQDVYSAQIRGAIAHSKFYFSGNYISLTNKHFREGFNIGALGIEDWYIKFNKSVLLYNEMLGQRSRWLNYYTQLAKELHNGVAVITPEINIKTGQKRQKFVRPDDRNTWRWVNN
jgi:hypothetical protein